MNPSTGPSKLSCCAEFIRFFAMSLANGTLYSPCHPQVSRLCGKAFETLRKALGEDQGISFLLIDDQIIVASQPLAKGPYAERVSRAFRDKKIEHVEFFAGVTASDILQLVGNLLPPKTSYENLAPSPQVRFGKIALSATEKMEKNDDGKENNLISHLEDLPQVEFRIFAEIYERAKSRQSFSLRGLSEMVSGLIGILREDLDSFLLLSALQKKDKYTFTHSTNVGILNLAQAASLKIEGQLLHDIGIAGMRHDVGKLFIPEEILCKPGKLDEKETTLMRRHPVKGAEYLHGISNIPPLAVSTAYEHHIDFGGGGYPRVPANWPLNLCSYITSISDIFDALRTKRSYQSPKDLPECKKIMLKLAGTKLHPALTSHFLSLADSVAIKSIGAVHS